MLLPSPPALAAFLAVVVGLVAAGAAAAYHAGPAPGAAPAVRRRAALLAVGALAAWLAFTFAVAARGALLDVSATPPAFARLLAPTALATCLLALSPFGARLATDGSLAWLVGFQGFRVAVELVLHALYAEGFLPRRMTFEGANFDVLTGASAVALALYARRRAPPPALVAAWNAAGLALLGAIVVISIRSAPGPLRGYFDGPPNAIVLHAPLVWLPTFVVPAALFGHLIVFRHLCHRRRPRAPTAA